MKLALSFLVAALSFVSVSQAKMSVAHKCNHWNSSDYSEKYGDIEILEDGYPVTQTALRFTNRPKEIIPVKVHSNGPFYSYTADKVAVEFKWIAGAGHLQGSVYYDLQDGSIYTPGAKEFQIICTP